MRAPDPKRTADLKAIHAVVRELALDDATYRALLLRTGGKRSSADMTVEERGRVLDELRRLGAGKKGTGRGHRPQSDNPLARKALGLWISLYHLGAIDDSSDRALAAFAKRQVGIEDLRWLKPSQGFKLIAALKARCEREGYEPDTEKAGEIGRGVTTESYKGGTPGFDMAVPPDLDQPVTRGLQTLLIEAQWKKLQTNGALKFGESASIYSYLKCNSVPVLSIARQREIIENLGRWIRRHQAATRTKPAEAVTA